MTGAFVSLLGLAVLDSINPSALAVTIYLLLGGKSQTPRVLVYVLAVFLSYLAIGVVLMLGLGSVWGFMEGWAAYAVQGVAGALLLGYAFLAPDRPRGARDGKEARMPGSGSLGAIFLLGVSITLVEASTAFPYLGAVAILTNAGLAVAQWLPILVVYNVIFVLPPLLLIAAYRAFGARARGVLERLRERFEGGSRAALLWIAGLVGGFLLVDSLAYFEFFGLFGLVDVLETRRGW